MSRTPDVSVIMASYNCSPYLRAAIRSVQSQTLSTWELVIVDDASSDGSADLAEEMSRRDGRIKVFRLAANRGPGAARNTAIDAARGRWLAIFDSDDLMSPHRLNMLLSRAEVDKAVIAADNQLWLSEDPKNRRLLFPRNARPRSIALAEFVDSNRLYSAAPDLGYLKPLIHAPTLKQIGARYDQELRIGEDYEFMARLLAAGLSIRLDPQPLYLYRRRAQSLSYRLREEDILALINAEDRLAGNIASPTPQESRALRRRRRSLQSLLTYDHVVTAIKSRRFGRAAELALGAPPIWPLLTRPVRVRARRLLAHLAATARRHVTVLSETQRRYPESRTH